MWIEINVNPEKNNVGDCTVRALSIALGKSWRDTYRDLVVLGCNMADMPSSNAVWGEYLKRNGFERARLTVPFTVREFCDNHTQGLYVLGLRGHVVVAINGNYYDSWNSGEQEVLYVWTRQ